MLCKLREPDKNRNIEFYGNGGVGGVGPTAHSSSIVLENNKKKWWLGLVDKILLKIFILFHFHSMPHSLNAQMYAIRLNKMK